MCRGLPLQLYIAILVLAREGDPVPTRLENHSFQENSTDDCCSALDVCKLLHVSLIVTNVFSYAFALDVDIAHLTTANVSHRSSACCPHYAIEHQHALTQPPAASRRLADAGQVLFV